MGCHEKRIQKVLNDYSNEFKYKFYNEYFFKTGNESDFIGIDEIGNCIEIEIKASTQDFKKDFEKIRHKVYNGYFEGENSIVKNKGVIRSRNISWKECEELKEFIVSEKYDKNICIHIDKSTEIEIIQILPNMIPNQFYYLCPERKVIVDNLPPYAGLMYLDKEDNIKIVKRAPIINKDKIELSLFLDIAYKKYSKHFKDKFEIL